MKYKKLGLTWKNPMTDAGDFSFGQCVDEDLIYCITKDNTNGRHLICIDHKDCFNKESQCPIQIQIPASFTYEEIADKISDEVTFLKSIEGRRASNHFDWSKFKFANTNVRRKFYNHEIHDM